MADSIPESPFDHTKQRRPRLFRWSSDPDHRISAVIENPDDVAIWLVDLDCGESDPVAPPIDAWFGDVLDAEELTRAKRFIKPMDRLRFARCRSAVRSILGQIQGIPPATVNFGTGPYGKPFLRPPPTNEITPVVEFNVSHSGAYALVAVSPRRALGVDLERIRSIGEAERIVSSFFTEAEKCMFATIEPDRRDSAFMRGWTRKEAILKGTGKGLAGGASGYESLFGTSPLTSEFEPASPCPIVAGWMLWEAAIEEGYVATLAVATDSVTELVRLSSSS